MEYKLDDIYRDYLSQEINNQEYQNEIKEIDGLTAELVEKVNDRGFYLIRVPLKQPYRRISEPERTKILFASANPVNLSPIRLDKELREIEYELLKSRHRDRFELVKFQAVRIGDLQDALLEHNPQFIHFSGHGNCEGIALVDDLDNTKMVKSKPLANLFNLFSGDIRCVFLNSCHSVEQSKEIAKSIKKVICMSNEVPDDVAIQFAKAFYKSIGAGKDIDFSFKFAQNSIELYGLKGSEIPVLLPEELN